VKLTEAERVRTQPTRSERMRLVVMQVILVLVLLALAGLGGWFIIGGASRRRR